MAFLYLRYVELNTKLQASFRRYNSAIPSYLRERPHHIIKHSMDRLSLAESILSYHSYRQGEWWVFGEKPK